MSQPTNQFNVRQECVNITNHILDFSRKFVKHQTIMGFVYGIFQPRINKIILNEASDEDIKTMIVFIKGKVDGLYSQVDQAEQLKEARKLNSPEMTKKLESLPNYQKIMEQWG